VRSRKALQLLGIHTVGDLAARTEAELMGVKNFGQTSLDELKALLTRNGLTLRQLD
jgi:DNA-directed RNA polymerase subunit alpha